MTNEELITKVVKENYEMITDLNEIYKLATKIHGLLYCIGGGLNDNVKGYNKEQMKDLFIIANLADDIRSLSNLKGNNVQD